MFENKNLRYILFFFIFVLLISYISGLYIDVTRDAGKYATISKEIFQNGNFINLTIHGDPYDQKPPLLFWLGALGFAIGGISNFWFKLPVLLLVFAGIYWGYRLGRSLYNRRVALITAFLLFCSFIYILYSMDIHTDTLLQAFVTLALWQIHEFLVTGRTRNCIYGFIAIGLAMLSKGPIGAIIPAFAIIGHMLLNRNFNLFADYRWYLGILISLLVVSPALIGLFNQFGFKGLYFFFWENMAGRITGSYVKAVNDPVFYFHNLFYQFLPWTILFYVSAFLEFRYLIKSRFKSAEYFTFAGIWIYFIILNASSSQLPNYVFSIIPLIAVLTAKWIDNAVSEKKILWNVYFNIQNIISIILWIGIFVLVFYLFKSPPLYIWIVLSLGIISTILVYFKSKNPIFKLLTPSVIVFSVLAMVMNFHVFPYMFAYQAPPKAARYFTENKSENEKLYNYKYGQYELFFYSEPQAEQIDNNAELIEIAGKNGSWLFTDEEGFQEIQKLNLKADTIISYQHLYLDRGGRFANPKTREKVLKPMYLIKY